MEQTNINDFGKKYASSFSSSNKNYNDAQIFNSDLNLNEVINDENTPQFLKQNDNDIDPSNQTLSEKDSLLQNALFGLRSIENFTLNKKEAMQNFYNLLTLFSTNYNIEEDELPDNISTSNKIMFTVRFIETLLDLTKMDITKEQKELIFDLIKYGLNIINEISNV